MSGPLESALRTSQLWLKTSTKRMAFKRLSKEIVETGVCTECGACVGNCPVNALTGEVSQGRYVPTLTGECISCGICYTVCPRTYSLWSELVGPFRSAWKVKSKTEGPRQDGGAVTAFLSFLLDTAAIDAAVVARRDTKGGPPRAVTVRTAQEARESGGSVYSHIPVVEQAVRAFKEGHRAIAVVGTSCSLDALHKMETHPAGLLQVEPRFSVFKIGLFCMESFVHKGLMDYLQERGIDIRQVKKWAITKGMFQVQVDEGVQEWPVSELSPVAASSCSYCHDFTCMNADISCGSVGSEDGWTTVLVRSARGECLLQGALAAGSIEAQMLDEKEMRTIETVARSKAMRTYTLRRYDGAVD
ncbi:MAG: Coenzyme F420 hydrogenase/dehydrogenase, beta subunit C-terminal domain [Candidatus Thorarchaeota archaeon]|nr:Coenzyme F420 hydrogenase/dehydrogenase, beta subunit C-terminal domain [Candidatus Thorarchaeota archaeon]